MPCEAVARGQLCHHEQGVQEKFPHDRWLAQIGAQSCFGVPLLDAQGAVLGHLAVLDDRPMPDAPSLLGLPPSTLRSRMKRPGIRRTYTGS